MGGGRSGRRAERDGGNEGGERMQMQRVRRQATEGEEKEKKREEEEGGNRTKKWFVRSVCLSLSLWQCIVQVTCKASALGIGTHMWSLG